MGRIQAGSVVKRGESIRGREFGDAGVLLDVSSGEYVQTDEVGLAIWEQIDGRKTAAEIVEALAAHFDADAQTIAGDTAEFIEELLERGLVSLGR